MERAQISRPAVGGSLQRVQQGERREHAEWGWSESWYLAQVVHEDATVSRDKRQRGHAEHAGVGVQRELLTAHKLGSSVPVSAVVCGIPEKSHQGK